MPGTRLGIFFQLLCPHIASVVALRPLYECRRTTSGIRPVATRAAATAVSFASVPDDVKNVFLRFPGAIDASFSARFDCGALAYSVDVWLIFLTCSTIASTTFGFAWPTETVRTPPNASRYRRPWSSQT